MKKFILIFITCLFFTSCYTDGTKSISNKGIVGDVYIKEITYNGHSYIEFKDAGAHGQGWVHNPDCLKKDLDSLINKNN